MTRVIAVASGKGGVGKSNLSLNLALCLDDLGRRTCLFDADLGLANVNILLGLYPEQTLEDVVFKGSALRKIVVRTADGPDIIPGSSGLEEMANLDAGEIEKVLGALSDLTGYDYLILDTSSGIAPHVLAFCLAASQTVVVLTPEPTSMIDAFALLKVLKAHGLERSVPVVLNQVPDKETAKNVFRRFREVVRDHLDLDVKPLGLVLSDSRMVDAVKRQRPLMRVYPGSMAARCIRVVAERLDGRWPDLVPETDMSTFWRRFFEQLETPLETADAASEPDTPEVSAAPAPESSSEVSLPIERVQDLPMNPLVVSVLVRLLEREAFDAGRLARIISLDPVLALTVLTHDALFSANGRARQHPDLLGAVRSLGPATIKHVVRTAAVRLAFSPFNEERIRESWRIGLHSLACAELARLIASQADVTASGEAFVAGMLHDLGRLAVLGMDQSDSPPEEHARIGGRMIAAEGLTTLVADAVRYHHEPVSRVEDAFLLVKAVHMADAAMRGDDFPQTVSMPGLTDQILTQYRSRAELEVNRAAALLGLDPEQPETVPWEQVRQELLQEARTLAMLSGAMDHSVGAADREAAVTALYQDVTALFGVRQVLFFLVDPQNDCLRAVATHPGMNNGFLRQLKVPLTAAGSLLAGSFAEGKARQWTGYKDSDPPPAVVDEQLLRLLGEDVLYLLPLVHAGSRIGVMALGLDRFASETLAPDDGLLLRFASQAASILERIAPTPTTDEAQ